MHLIKLIMRFLVWCRCQVCAGNVYCFSSATWWRATHPITGHKPTSICQCKYLTMDRGRSDFQERLTKKHNTWLGARQKYTGHRSVVSLDKTRRRIGSILIVLIGCWLYDLVQFNPFPKEILKLIPSLLSELKLKRGQNVNYNGCVQDKYSLRWTCLHNNLIWLNNERFILCKT